MAGITESWLLEHARHQDDECLIWPFSQCGKGYGQAWFRGRLIVAHRAMCILAHGAPCALGLHAAHSCGTRMCVNPLHLRWASASDNEIDKRMHGTAQIGSANGSAKLNEYAAATIFRRIAAGERDALIAADYGVDRKTISAMRFGRTWRHVKRNEEAA